MRKHHQSQCSGRSHLSRNSSISSRLNEPKDAYVAMTQHFSPTGENQPVTPYPQIVEYNEVIQHPATAFVDPELQQGRVKENTLGLPIVLSGGFALTYTITTPQRQLAVRCFHPNSSSGPEIRCDRETHRIFQERILRH